MSKKSSSKETPVEQSARDRNPNNQGFKAAKENHSIQLNTAENHPTSTGKPSAKKE